MKEHVLVTNEEFADLLERSKKFDRMMSPGGDTVYTILDASTTLEVVRTAETGKEKIIVLRGAEEANRENVHVVNAFSAEKAGVAVLARGLIKGHAMALVNDDEYALFRAACTAEEVRNNTLKNFFK